MDALKMLLERRSVRSYQDKQVAEEELKVILEAGTYAASAMGAQNTQMVVVRDAETVKMLSKMNAKVLGNDSDPFYGAPMVVVVFGKGPCALQDASLVMGNLMNAAYAVGVSSCWINRATEMFESEEGKALKAKWGVAEEYIGVGNCILGYAAAPAAAPKARKDDFIIFA